MANTKFDKLLGLLEPLETDSIGEWIIDKEHKGTGRHEDCGQSFRTAHFDRR